MTELQTACQGKVVSKSQNGNDEYGRVEGRQDTEVVELLTRPWVFTGV